MSSSNESDAFPVSNYFDLRPRASYEEITFEFLDQEYNFMTKTCGVSHQKALSTLVYIATRQRILGEETLLFLDSKNFDYNSPLHLTSRYLVDDREDPHPRTKYLVLYACENRNLNLLKALHARGAKLDVECTYDFMYDEYGELTSTPKPIRNWNAVYDDDERICINLIKMSHYYNMTGLIEFLEENGIYRPASEN